MSDPRTAPPTQGSVETCDQAELETLAQYGITRVPATAYLVGGYRYSSLADAVAQARRDTKSI